VIESQTKYQLLDMSGFKATVWPKKKVVGSCALLEERSAPLAECQKIDSESGLRHTSPRCDTLSDRCVLLCSSRCASDSRLPRHFWHCFCFYANAADSDEMASRRSQRRASNGSDQERGHEITNFHPVVSHLAGTPSVDRVPVDSICALAHALDRSPHALPRIPTCTIS
jgi:hypothetical protein